MPSLIDAREGGDLAQGRNNATVDVRNARCLCLLNSDLRRKDLFHPASALLSEDPANVRLVHEHVRCFSIELVLTPFGFCFLRSDRVPTERTALRIYEIIMG